MTALEGVFLVFGLACLTGCVLSVSRALVVIRLVLRGERTQGWCARRAYRRDGRSYSHPEFTFAFRTPDGELVEFKDRPGAFGYEEGASVRVCYDPARPRKRATIAGPDTWGPVYVRLLFCVPLGILSFVPLYSLALHWGLFRGH
ncbi:DUF3592 domain-containing protein [Microtetraspora sp. NBRC 16547]|uniref:DUF3592 domain-containing protein n=1 Tax=Microtetraspora sp. NBRC 16547 TaxID=3030993 RepID=UPI0024A1F9CD|nr:DUF3592 domain-containing protein [Microtetraspora sp. NBRC 16547]GLX02757.1 hypothetical protein Misp02_68430 [Microtetraspora sp. NBRC 16547]